MEFTGERFVPGERGQIKYEHLHRYALSLDFAAGKSVLDIASGEGYGAALLAQVAQVVTGVDIDPDSINHAKHRYYYPNLYFSVGSCQSIPLPDESVDLVTSFETIEHHEDHQGMMQEIKRVLKPDGVLIISSPNRLIYSDEPSYANPFHLKELYFDEFNNLLGQYFKHVLIYGQRLAAGSFVYPMGEPCATTYKAFTGDAESLHQRVACLNAPLYFIAICSNHPLNDEQVIDSVYLDDVDDLFKSPEIDREQFTKSSDSQTQRSGAAAALAKAHEAQINQLTQELARVREQYEAQLNLEREQSLAKDWQLRETGQTLSRTQQLLHEKEQELASSDVRLGEYLLQIQAKDQLLESLKISRSAEGLQSRLAAAQLAPESQSFDETTLLQEIERQLGEREPYIKAKDLQVEELEQRVQMYHQVTENFWKFSYYRMGRFMKRALRKIKRAS